MGGIIQGRSGLSINHNIETGNAGVIDSGYHGTVKIKLYNHDFNEPYRISVGDRIAQMVFHIRPAEFLGEMSKQLLMSHGGFEPFGFYPFKIEELDIAKWPETDRGRLGVGSTGVK